jgi:hypothetical protein
MPIASARSQKNALYLVSYSFLGAECSSKAGDIISHSAVRVPFASYRNYHFTFVFHSCNGTILASAICTSSSSGTNCKRESSHHRSALSTSNAATFFYSNPWLTEPGRKQARTARIPPPANQSSRSPNAAAACFLSPL